MQNHKLICFYSLTDPGGHSLVWAGYGGVAAAPPVVIPPQQLLLPDAHYHRAIHAHTALLHVPHAHAPVHATTPPSIKREDPLTPGTPEEDPKSRPVSVPPSGQGAAPPGSEMTLPPALSTGLRHLPPSFLYPPPSSLPYYCSQSPHPSPYSLPPFPHQPTSTISSNLTSARAASLTTTLTNTLTTPADITTTYSVLPTAPVTSVAKGIGFEHCSSRGCEALVATGSPTPQSESSESVNITSHSEEEPDMEPQLSRTHPQAERYCLPVPFKIKQEIKEEVPSPAGSSREEACTPGAGETPVEAQLSQNHIPAVKKEAVVNCMSNQLSDAKTSTTAFLIQNSEPCVESSPVVYPAISSKGRTIVNYHGNPNSPTASNRSLDTNYQETQTAPNNQPPTKILSESPVSKCLQHSALIISESTADCSEPSAKYCEPTSVGCSGASATSCINPPPSKFPDHSTASLSESSLTECSKSPATTCSESLSTSCSEFGCFQSSDTSFSESSTTTCYGTPVKSFPEPPTSKCSETPASDCSECLTSSCSEIQRANASEHCFINSRKSQALINPEPPPVMNNTEALVVSYATPAPHHSGDVEPLYAVHSEPNTLTYQDQHAEDLRTSCTLSNEEQTASVTEPSTQDIVNPSYMDLSGLELLSQSVLQHANRLSDLPEEETIAGESSSLQEDASADEYSSSLQEAVHISEYPSSQQGDINANEYSSLQADEACTDECSSSQEVAADESSLTQEQVPTDECSSSQQEETTKNLSSTGQNKASTDKYSTSLQEKASVVDCSSLMQEATSTNKFFSEGECESSLESRNKLCPNEEETSSGIGEACTRGKMSSGEGEINCSLRDEMPELVQASIEMPCQPISANTQPQYATPPVVTSLPDSLSGLHGLSLLCALAEQRILEEEQVACPDLSSLADVAATSPSVPTFPQERSPSPQPGPSCLTISASRTFGCGTITPIFGASPFGTLANSFSTPVKTTDVNRNYKSPQSEREAKAFIANKASQYQKETTVGFKAPSGFPVDSMDPAELDMRMQLAELQRKYREKQRELSRLQPKKITVSPTKRGPGRPPKRKIRDSGIPGKRKVGRPPSKKKKSPQKELSPPVLERVTDLQIKNTTKDSDEEKEEPRCASKSILKPPVLTATFSTPVVLNGNQDTTPKTPETQLAIEKEESGDDDTDKDKTRRWSLSSEDTAPPVLGSPFKLPTTAPETRQEESEEEQTKYAVNDSSSRELKVLQMETSVESSPSDLEQQPFSSSSSKKRKPGRPKKHSPTKEDATETIVAKKPKTLSFHLHRPLLSHKPKMRPKLKAEVKVGCLDVFQVCVC